MAKAMDLRELDDVELVGRLGENRRELFNLRFQSVTGKLDNYSRLRELRRDIARMATVLREREIARAEGRYDDALPQEAVHATSAKSEVVAVEEKDDE